MATATITYRFTGIGDSEEVALSKTFAAGTFVEETVSNGASATQINVAIDVSEVEAFYLVSDQDVTFKTNSNSAPDDTISLVANVPYVWHATDYSSFLLGTDVTAVHVVNTSGTAANLSMRVGQDPTP